MHRCVRITALSLIVLFAARADATTKNDPLRVWFEPSGRVAADATTVAGDLVFESSIDLRLDDLRIDVTGGFVDGSVDVPSDFAVGEAQRRPVVIHAATASLRLEVSYGRDAGFRRVALDLAPAKLAVAQSGARLVAHDEPGEPATRRWSDTTPDERAAARAAADATFLERRSGPTFDLTVDGTITYEHANGSVGIQPAGHVKVEVWEDTASGLDRLFATGFADEDGDYSLNFTWSPECGTCDLTPNLYVLASLTDATGDILLRDYDTNATLAARSFTLEDIDGSSPVLDFPTLSFVGPPAETAHAFTILKNTHDRMLARGYDVDGFRSYYPEPNGGAYYSGGNLFFSAGSAWNAVTVMHEYGHHWHAQAAAIPILPFNYCNGTCDADDSDCGHCAWCEEDLGTTINESLATFLALGLIPELETEMGRPFPRANEYEITVPCNRPSNPCTDCDPMLTEGYLIAFLRDVVDTDNENDTEIDAVYGDELSEDFWEVLDIMATVGPSTVEGWFDAILGEIPFVSPERLWKTGRNNGYDFDVTDPGAVTNLASPSHAVGVSTPSNRVSMNWLGAPDDFSGIQAYSILLSTNPSEVVDYLGDIDGDAVNTVFENVAPGTYWFSIRAQDRSNNWSPQTVQYGPIVVRAPQLSDLRFETSGSFTKAVMPQTADFVSRPGVFTPSNVLPSGPDAVWAAFQFLNDGESPVDVPITQGIFRDGALVYAQNLGGASPGQVTGFAGVGPFDIRGGRHVIAVELDAGSAVAETDETNNLRGHQWVFEPPVLSPTSTLVSRPAPAPRTAGWDALPATETRWWNADGHRIGISTGWSAVGVLPNDTAHDFDVRVHPQATTATSGFGGHIGSSTRGPGLMDAVFVNRQGVQASTFDIGVSTDQDLAGETYRLFHVQSSIQPVGPVTTMVMGTNQSMILREFQVFDPGAGDGKLTLEVESQYVTVPIHVGILDDDTDGAGMEDFLYEARVDATGASQLTMDLPEAGYYGLVIWREAGPVTPVATSLDVRLYRTHADLVPNTPTTWYAPLVPRNDDFPILGRTPLGAPTILYGDSAGGSTWFGTSIRNAGVATTPNTATNVSVDGRVVETFTWSPLAEGAVSNDASGVAHVISGGRHTIAAYVDPIGNVEETSEKNNIFAEQWVWRPSVLPLGRLSFRSPPPGRFAGHAALGPLAPRQINTDAIRVNVPPATTKPLRIVAALPGVRGDVDLRAHARSDDPKTALSDLLAVSAWGLEQMDYLIHDLDEDPASTGWDVGITEGTLESTTDVAVQVAEAVDLGRSPANTGAITMADDEIVHLYRLELSPGLKEVRLVPRRRIGQPTPDVDWGLTIHTRGAAWIRRDDHAENASSYVAPAGDEERALVPVAGGQTDLVIVVFRRDTDAMVGEADYELVFQDVTSTDPTIPAARSTGLETIHPNPFNPRTTVDFALEREGHVALDVYDVRGKRVRTLADGAFPAGHHAVAWDGVDDRGRPVVSGVYFVRMRAAGVDDRRKITLVK